MKKNQKLKQCNVMMILFQLLPETQERLTISIEHPNAPLENKNKTTQAKQKEVEKFLKEKKKVK